MLDSKSFVSLMDNQDIVDHVTAHVLPAYLAMKQNRQEMEQRWVRYLRMWAVKRGDDQIYDGGGADIRQPTVRKSIESVAKKNYQSFFGGGTDYFSVTPSFGSMGSTIDDAEATKNTIKHFFEGHTDIKSEMMHHFRQKAIYGSSVVKAVWYEKERQVKNRGKNKTILKEYPKVKVLDMFKWYGFPDNVRRIDDLIMTFEEFFKPQSYVDQMKEFGFYSEDFNPAANQKRTSFDQERAQLIGTNPVNTNTNHGNIFHNLVEVYFLYELEDGIEQMLMAHMTEQGDIAMICFSPFEHGEFPYAIDKHVENAVDSLYGCGIPEVVESQYYELNDISNQMMDSRSLALNPIAIIDPNGVRDFATIKIAPRAKWLADPRAIEFKTFPDLSVTGINSFNLVKNEILEASENMPNLPPQMRGASRTASRDQAMQVEMNSELSETMTHSALMCKRILKLTHALIIQYMSKELVIRINKKKSAGYVFKTITIDDINGDFEFEYKAAQDTSLDRVAVNQLTNVIKIAAAFPNVKLKMDNIMRRLLVDGFGFDDYEEIMEADSLSQEMSQELENTLLSIGKVMPISVNDDDGEHLRILTETYQGKKLKESVQHAVLDHMKRHRDGLELKRSIMQQQMQATMMEQYQQANGQQPGQEVMQGQGQATMMKQGSEADRTGTSNTNMEQTTNG